MARPNQYAEAFREPMNAVGLATMAAICFATFNPLPLLAGIVAEAAYLLMVPDSHWFRDRLARVEEKCSDDRLVGGVLAFIRSGTRPLANAIRRTSAGAEQET